MSEVKCKCGEVIDFSEYDVQYLTDRFWDYATVGLRCRCGKILHAKVELCVRLTTINEEKANA